MLLNLIIVTGLAVAAVRLNAIGRLFAIFKLSNIDKSATEDN